MVFEERPSALAASGGAVAAAPGERKSSRQSPTRRSLSGIAQVTDELLLCGAPALSPLVLGGLGVTCVVNAAPELPDTPLPVSSDVHYIRVNVRDTATEDIIASLDAVADTIERVRLAGGLTLVHCVAGVSRSATLCLAYLVKHRGMSLREAYVHLKKARPCVRPNCGFFNQLIDFERKTRGNASVSMVTVLGVLVPDVYQDDYQNMLCTRNCTTATAVGPH